MSEWRLVRLNFGRSPVHFGETGIGLEKTTERVRSDTLFSAWVSTYARALGTPAIEELLGKFIATPESPPFRISSTFVYRRLADNTFVDYLPKPIERPLGYPNNDLSFAKSYKKLGYLPLPVWKRWYQGSGFSDQDRQDLEHYASHPMDTSTDLAKAGCFRYSDAFKAYELPKVAISRRTHATNFYHTGLTQFAWDLKDDQEFTAQQDNPSIEKHCNWEDSHIKNLAGLYFLLEFSKNSSELEDNLKQILQLLGEEGIGGERSTGAGRFTVLEWNSLPTDWQEIVNFSGGDHYSLVSLFWNHDLSQDWLGTTARYIVQERGGWITSSFSGRQLRRQMVRMFVEGSIFPNKPFGELANVTPPEFTKHSVYRSGIAVSLPVKLGGHDFR